MKKIIVAVCFAGLVGVAVAQAGDAKTAQGPSCGQMVAEKAVLPAKMAEMMTAVADMQDAHAAFMMMDKSKEAKAEATELKKLATMHRNIATEYGKTATMMKDAAKWPAAAHDMGKMMADPKIQESMKKMLTTHKEMVALLQKEVSMMESMHGPKTN